MVAVRFRVSFYDVTASGTSAAHARTFELEVDLVGARRQLAVVQRVLARLAVLSRVGRLRHDVERTRRRRVAQVCATGVVSVAVHLLLLLSVLVHGGQRRDDTRQRAQI